LIKQKGYEADDFMYFIVNKYADTFDEIIMASSDSDLHTLLSMSPGISIDKNKGIKYTYMDFKRDYQGISTDDWVKICALSGTHNAVPQAVPRCGEKTAIKIFLNKEKWDAAYAEHKEQIDLNEKLIRLPFDENIDGSLIQFNTMDFRVGNILGFLKRTYNIDATMGIEMALQKLSSHINVMGV
jgi:5'-3' exonuclease